MKPRVFLRGQLVVIAQLRNVARALSNAHGYVSVQNAAWTTLSVAKPLLERLTNTHRRRDTSPIRAHKRTAQQLQLRSCTAHAYVNATRKKPFTYHTLDRAISTTGNFPAEPNIIFRKSKDRTSKNINLGAYTDFFSPSSRQSKIPLLLTLGAHAQRGLQ